MWQKGDGRPLARLSRLSWSLSLLSHWLKCSILSDDFSYLLEILVFFSPATYAILADYRFCLIGLDEFNSKPVFFDQPAQSH